MEGVGTSRADARSGSVCDTDTDDLVLFLHSFFRLFTLIRVVRLALLGVGFSLVKESAENRLEFVSN
jgi:hypothetical protein